MLCGTRLGYNRSQCNGLVCNQWTELLVSHAEVSPTSGKDFNACMISQKSTFRNPQCVAERMNREASWILFLVFLRMKFCFGSGNAFSGVEKKSGHDGDRTHVKHFINNYNDDCSIHETIEYYTFSCFVFASTAIPIWILLHEANECAEQMVIKFGIRST